MKIVVMLVKHRKHLGKMIGRGGQHDVWGHGEGTQVIDFYLGHPTRWHCDNNDGDK